MLLVAVAWLAFVSMASAQDDEVLWRQGVALRREGRDAEALATFEQAHQQTGTRRTLAQVALAEQALGRWGAAARHLDSVLAEPDGWVNEHRTTLAQARADIAQHVGRLEVLVNRPGAQIVLDGTLAGTSPLPGPVAATAGTVSIRVIVEGAVVAERSTTVTAGALARESITLAGSSSGGASAGGGDSTLVVLGAVLLGTGVAAAIGMAIAWAVREARAAYFNSDACFDMPGVTRNMQCRDVRAAVSDAGTAAIVLGAVGGGLLVTGAILLGVGLSAGGGGSSAPIECAPTLGPGLACGGAF